MIDFTSINSVVRRISDIENRVGMKRHDGGGASFSRMLEEEMRTKAMRKSPAPSTNTAAHGSEQTAAFPAAKLKAPEAAADKAIAEAVRAPSRYDSIIKAAAEKYGVDPRLVSAVAEVESGFDQSAVSGVGAIGVMQLMPETAAALGVDPYDAVQNIEGGARYLRDMLDAFAGDERKAVAAYNAGPGAVNRYGGIPPYAETRAYVNSVLDLYH